MNMELEHYLCMFLNHIHLVCIGLVLRNGFVNAFVILVDN